MFEDNEHRDAVVALLIKFRGSSTDFVKFLRGAMAVLSASTEQHMVKVVWPELVSVSKRMKDGVTGQSGSCHFR